MNSFYLKEVKKGGKIEMENDRKSNSLRSQLFVNAEC